MSGGTENKVPWVEKNQKLISGGNAYQKPDSKLIVYHKKLDKNYISQEL